MLQQFYQIEMSLSILTDVNDCKDYPQHCKHAGGVIEPFIFA